MCVIFRLGCTEKVNQSFGRLDISFSIKFDPYCNWIVGNSGISQAVAIVSIHQMNLRENSRYVYFIYFGDAMLVNHKQLQRKNLPRPVNSS